MPANKLGGKRKFRTPEQNDQILGKLRVGELNKLFAYRNGGSREGWQFPQNADGYESLKVLIQHYRRSNPWKMAKIIQMAADEGSATKDYRPLRYVC